MQIKNISNCIYFGKTYAAGCAIKKPDGQSVDCSIFKLDPKEDKDYFIALYSDKNWENSAFIEDIEDDTEDYNKYVMKKKMNIYAMENSSGDCLGLMETTEKLQDDNSIYVEYLETAPGHRNQNIDGKSKYVGETFLSFLSKLAKKQNKKYIQLETLDSSKDFYLKKCYFRKNKKHKDSENKEILILPGNKFDKLIRQNEKHTEKNITLIA